MAAKISEPRVFSSQFVVFVEGDDEVNVFSSMLKDMAIEGVQILAVGGKYKLDGQFAAATRSPGFDRVRAFAIVQDADTDAAAAFDRVKGVLQKNSCAFPNASGEFRDAGGRRVGVLILPGDGGGGCLEDLFLRSCANESFHSCMLTFVDCVQNARETKLNSKQKAHVAMAALDVPEPRLGRAFQSGMINGNHDAYEGVKNFLRELTANPVGV